MPERGLGLVAERTSRSRPGSACIADSVANEQLLRKHAEQGGFPINRISLVTGMIDPTTSEARVAEADAA